MNMLQTIFLENIFLALVEEEKVGEKRSTAKEMMLTCQMIQILNFLKKAKTWVIRKMRNVIKLSQFYYKQKNDLLSQHPNDCCSHTLTEWSFPQRIQPGEFHCSHWTISFVKPFPWTHDVTSEFSLSVTPVPPGNMGLSPWCSGKIDKEKKNRLCSVMT